MSIYYKYEDSSKYRFRVFDFSSETKHGAGTGFTAAHGDLGPTWEQMTAAEFDPTCVDWDHTSAKDHILSLKRRCGVQNTVWISVTSSLDWCIYEIARRLNMRRTEVHLCAIDVSHGDMIEIDPVSSLRKLVQDEETVTATKFAKAACQKLILGRIFPHRIDLLGKWTWDAPGFPLPGKITSNDLEVDGPWMENLAWEKNDTTATFLKKIADRDEEVERLIWALIDAMVEEEKWRLEEEADLEEQRMLALADNMFEAERRRWWEGPEEDTTDFSQFDAPFAAIMCAEDLAESMSHLDLGRFYQ